MAAALRLGSLRAAPFAGVRVGRWERGKSSPGLRPMHGVSPLRGSHDIYASTWGCRPGLNSWPPLCGWVRFGPRRLPECELDDGSGEVFPGLAPHAQSVAAPRLTWYLCIYPGLPPRAKFMAAALRLGSLRAARFAGVLVDTVCEDRQSVAYTMNFMKARASNVSSLRSASPAGGRACRDP